MHTFSSPHEFELCLRQYIETQVEALARLRPDERVSVTLLVTPSYADGSLNYQWIVRSYDGGGDTKGEVLALCFQEYKRRRQADQANTLMLLDHTPGGFAPHSDEIPF